MGKKTCHQVHFYLTEREDLVSGGKFVYNSIDPFQEGILCAGKQTGNHNTCLLGKIGKNLPFISRSLKKKDNNKQPICTQEAVPPDKKTERLSRSLQREHFPNHKFAIQL